MGELAGGVVAIWLLSRLVRIVLKRIPSIQPRLAVLLSVGIALAVSVSIAQGAMGDQAQQFGYSTWGYALLVYGPGAIFWTVLDLYRLSRRPPSQADAEAAALRLYEELRAEGHPVPDSPFRPDGSLMTAEEIGEATQQALTLRLYQRLKDQGLMVPDSPYKEDGTPKNLLEIGKELGDRSTAALIASDQPPTDQSLLEELVRRETERFRALHAAEDVTNREQLYRHFLSRRTGFQDPAKVENVLSLARSLAESAHADERVNIRLYHVLVGVMMYEHPKGGPGLVDKSASLPALALIKMMNAAQPLEESDL